MSSIRPLKTIDADYLAAEPILPGSGKATGIGRSNPCRSQVAYLSRPSGLWPLADQVRDRPGFVENANNFIRIESWDSVHVTLILDYSKERVVGGPEGVAFDTVEGLKKSHERLLDENIHIHIMSSSGSRSRSRFETDEEYRKYLF